MGLLFVGEERSELAIKMGVTWKDGRLAAKQLFDALNTIGIDPIQCDFTNLYETGGINTVINYKGVIVAMGKKVHKSLNDLKIEHEFIFHPAALGKIRKKENYIQHIKEQIGHLI